MLLLHGKGLWLQRIPDCEHGDLSAIIARAQAARLAHVILKVADGADAYNTDPATGRDFAAELTFRLSEAGVEVWGWHTLHGEKPAFKGAPELDYHLREAEAAVVRAEALSRIGLKGYVVEVRGEYERIPQRRRRAEEFMSRLRAALPLPMALSAWKSPASHPRFPWQEFREQCDLDLPQVFWIGKHREGARQLEAARMQFAALEPRLPFAATGPAFFEGDWRPSPIDITEFLAKATELLLPAASLWQWDHLGLTGDEDIARNPDHWDFSAHWQALAQFEWAGPTITASRPMPAAREVTRAVPVSIEPIRGADEEPPLEHLREFAGPKGADAVEGAQSIAEWVAEAETELPEHLREETAPAVTESPAVVLRADTAPAPLAPEYAEPAEPEIAAADAPAREAEIAEPALAPEPLLGTSLPEIFSPAEPTPSSEATAPAAPSESETAAEPSVSDESLEPAVTEPGEAETPEWLREPLEPEPPVSVEPTISASDAPPAETSFGLALSQKDDVAGIALHGDELPEWLHDVEAGAAEAVSFGLPADGAPEYAPLEQMPDLPEFALAFADRDDDTELPAWLQDATIARTQADDMPVSFGLETPDEEASDDYAAELETLLRDDAPDEVPEWLRDEGHAVHISAMPAPSAAPAHPTVTQFFKALRTGKLGEALALYGTGFAHANPERVTQQATEVYEFYHQFLREAQAGSLAIAGVSGSEVALTVRWSLRDAAGALVQGADTFHLNRAGKIVYHYTSLQLHSATQPA